MEEERRQEMYGEAAEAQTMTALMEMVLLWETSQPVVPSFWRP
jgi:hypothetical protein